MKYNGIAWGIYLVKQDIVINITIADICNYQFSTDHKPRTCSLHIKSTISFFINPPSKLFFAEPSFIRNKLSS